MFKLFKKRGQKKQEKLPEPREPNGEMKEAEAHMGLAFESIHTALSSVRETRAAARRLQESLVREPVTAKK
jgi:hypothetical protein